jgi:hypothetical protein
MRLIKAKKTLKNKDLDSMFKIDAGYERIGFFIIFELFFLHIISCFWVMVSIYNEENNCLTLRVANLADEKEVITTSF